MDHPDLTVCTFMGSSIGPKRLSEDEEFICSFSLQDAIEVVRKFMNRDPDQLSFTLMALACVK